MPYAQEAYKINRSLYGEDHYISFLSLETIVKALEASGKFKEALVEAKRVFYYYEKNFGKDHPKTKELSGILSDITRRAVAMVCYSYLPLLFIIQARQSAVTPGSSNEVATSA